MLISETNISLSVVNKSVFDTAGVPRHKLRDVFSNRLCLAETRLDDSQDRTILHGDKVHYTVVLL